MLNLHLIPITIIRYCVQTKMLRLHEFITELKACKDPVSEGQLIDSEISMIQSSFEKNEITFKARNVAKLMFLKTIGQEIEFGCDQALNLVNSSFLIEKRIGYLGLVHLFDSNVVLQSVSSLKRDLKSNNVKHRMLALSALANICERRPEVLCYLSEEINSCIKFSHALIQKKSILLMALAIRHSPQLSQQHQASIVNAIRLNQYHLLSQCLVFMRNATQLQCQNSQKYVELVPQIIELYSTHYESANAQLGENFLRDRFVLQNMLKFLELLMEKNKKIEAFFIDFFAQIIQNHQNDGTKIHNLVFVAYSLIKYAAKLSNSDPKSCRLVKVLLRHIMGVENANYSYISLNSLQIASKFNFQVLYAHLNYIISCLQSQDFSIRTQAVSLLFIMCQKNEQIAEQERAFYQSVVYIGQTVERAKNKPINHYTALLKVLILIIQSESNSFIESLLRQIRQCSKLKTLSVSSLFSSEQKVKNPIDMFFLVMSFILEKWSETADSVDDQEFQQLKEVDLEDKILNVLEAIFSLENVMQDSLQLKIPILLKISYKVANKQRVRHLASKFVSHDNKNIAKAGQSVVSQFQDSFPRSMAMINESSIRLKERKQSRERLNSSSEGENNDSVYQRVLNADEIHILKELNNENILEQLDADKVIPKEIKLVKYETGAIQMELGNSRVLEVLYYSGNDDRNSQTFKNVTEREVSFELTPEGIVKIDKYNRLSTLKAGNVQITVQSLVNKECTDHMRISVVDPKLKKTKKTKPLIRSYEGDSEIDEKSNLQKIVYRYANDKIEGCQQIPKHIKGVYFSEKVNKRVQSGSVAWTIEDYIDGSGSKYIKRVDSSLKEGDRDKVQYFIGNRYLPGDGLRPQSIESDGQNGVWVVGENGDITHIAMKKISYADKAIMMSRDCQKYVMRFGVVAGAGWNGSRWVAPVTDNDGLWTSMYSVGELMKYHTFKKTGVSSKLLKEARISALKTLKAVLMISNVSGREGTVKTKLRYLTNTRLGPAYWASDYYLKEGKTVANDNFVGSPAEGTGFYGVDAGKVTEGHYMGGNFRYSLKPFNPDDYTTDGPAAYTERTLKGFISRSFSIYPLQNFAEGLCFQRNEDGTQTVVCGAKTLYDYGQDDHPVLKVGNRPLPAILKDVLLVNGKQYEVKDLRYKADCSNDQIVGHLFVYKVGFDILDQKDSEQKAVKDLIRQTVSQYSQHLLDNNYTLCDATGQGTKWGKNTRDFLGSDHCIQDGGLHCLILMLTFKLAHYVTGESRWQDQYLLLVNHPSIRFLDLSTNYWQHWLYIGLNEDIDPKSNLYRLKKQDNPSEIQQFAHYLYSHNYSDEQMVMLALYLGFQLETDKTRLEKYRKVFDAWWPSISYSQNPLWYYIYQLSQPKQKILDGFGNEILEVAAWQLNRHPIDMIQYQAFVYGSRPDTAKDNKLSINPAKKIGIRTSETDKKNADYDFNSKISPDYDPKNIYQLKVLPADQRSIHKFNNTNFKGIDSGNKNGMEAPTPYTLPYWFGVYHGMLKFHPPTINQINE